MGTREAGQGGQRVEDNLRRASTGAEGEGKARPEVPRELTARTHVRTQRQAHWDLRALGLRGRGGGAVRGALGAPAGHCVGAVRAAGAGLPGRRGWGVALLRGEGGSRTPRVKNCHTEDYLFRAHGGQRFC